jgi:hypothetical protein
MLVKVIFVRNSYIQSIALKQVVQINKYRFQMVNMQTLINVHNILYERHVRGCHVTCATATLIISCDEVEVSYTRTAGPSTLPLFVQITVSLWHIYILVCEISYSHWRKCSES